MVPESFRITRLSRTFLRLNLGGWLAGRQVSIKSGAKLSKILLLSRNRGYVTRGCNGERTAVRGAVIV
jgi:hypothetical protein